MLIRALNAQCIYRDSSTTVGIESLTITINRGETVFFAGSSGGGKSTSLRLLSGILSPTSGTIERMWTNSHIVPYVFQSHNLLPWLTVLENVQLPLKLSGLSATESRFKAEATLRSVCLIRSANLFPRELSGGMMQRVGIARALVTDSPVVFMDEPFSSLDPALTTDLFALINDIRNNYGTTFVIASHDIDEMFTQGDRIVVFRNKRVHRIIECASKDFSADGSTKFRLISGE